MEQVNHYQQIYGLKQTKSKCTIPFCDGKGSTTGAKSHNVEKNCPNKEAKSYIDKIENLNKTLTKLNKANLSIIGQNRDLIRNQKKSQILKKDLQDENKGNHF